MKRCSKFIQHLKDRLTLSKRQQFVLVTLILTAELLATQLFSAGLHLKLLIFLSASAYILSGLSLREGLFTWGYITLLTLPTFYTAAVYLFYLLLPVRWLTRLPIALLYGVGMYAILLTENIFGVAAQRSIQLLRAAHSVGFLLTLVTVFFLMDTVISMHLPFYINASLAAIILIPLVLQALWNMELTNNISLSVWIGTGAISWVLVSLVIVFSFWPVKTTIEALFMTTAFYTLVGMTQQYLIQRLFHKTIREYLAVLVIVTIVTLITTRWG